VAKTCPHGRRAFTLIEVALIVAIIGMMLMILVGYLLAPRQKGPLPPLPQPTPFPFDRFTPVPLPEMTPRPMEAMPPRATPAATPIATPAPAPPPATPTATPGNTIELSPQSPSLFR
jgi:hypothetical protein